MRNLTFTHDFRDDLAQMQLTGEPYAFARMADGERALMMGTPIRGADGWTSPGLPWLMSKLWDCLGCADDGFHLGISCLCCDPHATEWYRKYAKLPESRLTYSNLFVNCNYELFADWIRASGISGITVGCRAGCSVLVPDNVVNQPWDFQATVDQMHDLRGPILVAAGPASAALILEYWRTAPKRQICLDVGSAADFLFSGVKTRSYHAGSKQVCKWKAE